MTSCGYDCTNLDRNTDGNEILVDDDMAKINTHTSNPQTLILCLEHLKIIYAPQQLQFENFGAFLKFKLWSDYLAHRQGLVRGIYSTLVLSPSRTAHYFVIKPKDTEEYNFNGTACHAFPTIDEEPDLIRSFFIVNKPTTTSAQSEASIHNDFTTHIQQSLGLACSFQHIMCDTSTNEKAECVALVCSLDGNGVVTGGGVPLELNGCGASVASDLSGTINTTTNRKKENGNWIDEDDEPQLFTMTNLLNIGDVGSYFNVNQYDTACNRDNNNTLNESGFFSCTDLDENNLDEGSSQWLRSLLNLCSGWRMPCETDNGNSIIDEK